MPIRIQDRPPKLGTFTCPTRNRDNESPKFTGRWTITERVPPEGRDSWLGDDTCSFCGGLRPSVMLHAMEAGEMMGANNDDSGGFITPGRRPFFFQHFDKDEQIEFLEVVNSPVRGQQTFSYTARTHTVPFFVFELAPPIPNLPTR